MDLEKRKETDLNSALTRISKTAESLQRSRATLADLIAPTTLSGKLRSFVTRYIPSSLISEWITDTPMARVQASLRESILNLYDDMGFIVRQGKERVAFHTELQRLVDRVSEQPSDEGVASLRDTLRSRAEEDLNLTKDPETEKLLDSLLNGGSEEQRKASTEKLIKEADQLLELSKPTIEALQVVLFGTVQTYDGLMATYGAVLELRPSFDVLHRSAGDLIRAQHLNIASFNTMLGEIDLAIAAARFAAEATEIGDHLSKTINLERLRQLQQKAVNLQRQQELIFNKSLSIRDLTEDDQS